MESIPVGSYHCLKKWSENISGVQKKKKKSLPAPARKSIMNSNDDLKVFQLFISGTTN